MFCGPSEGRAAADSAVDWFPVVLMGSFPVSAALWTFGRCSELLNNISCLCNNAMLLVLSVCAGVLQPRKYNRDDSFSWKCGPYKEV